MTNTEDFIDDLVDDEEEVETTVEKPVKETKSSKQTESSIETQKLYNDLATDFDIESKKLTSIIKDEQKKFNENYRQITNPLIRYNMIFANCESLLSALQNTVKVNFYVTGKEIKKWKDSIDVNITGILINPSNTKLRCPALLTQSYEQMDQIGFMTKALQGVAYKLNVSISKDVNLDYTRKHDNPQYLYISEITNFDTPIKSKQKAGLIKIYKDSYKIEPKSVIEMLDGREAIASDVSERRKKRDGTYGAQPAHNSIKLLMVLPKAAPKINSTSNNMNFQGITIGDHRELVQVFAGNFDEWKGWNPKKSVLLLACYVSPQRNSEYPAKYTLNVIGLEALGIEEVQGLVS